MLSNLVLVAHFVAPDELGIGVGNWCHWERLEIRETEFVCEKAQIVFLEGVHL